MRTGVLPQAVTRETSRFPSKKRPHMPGSLTTPGRQVLALTRLSVLPSTVGTRVGVPVDV